MIYHSRGEKLTITPLMQLRPDYDSDESQYYRKVCDNVYEVLSMILLYLKFKQWWSTTTFNLISNN